MAFSSESSSASLIHIEQAYQVLPFSNKNGCPLYKQSRTKMVMSFSQLEIDLAREETVIKNEKCEIKLRFRQRFSIISTHTRTIGRRKCFPFCKQQQRKSGKFRCDIKELDLWQAQH